MSISRQLSRYFSSIVFLCTIPFVFSCAAVAEAGYVDPQILTEAGVGILRAVTLDEAQAVAMSRQEVQQMDAQAALAPPDSIYARRAEMLSLLFRSVNGRELNFKVYMNDDINAFATADGSIRIFSGLMDRMNDAELIWVAGHEVSHVVHGHTLQKLQTAYYLHSTRLVVAAADSSGIAASELGGLFEEAINAQFSQQHEYQSDDTGLVILQSAGFHPMAAVSALEKLSRFSGNSNALGQFVSSHPAPEVRARRLRARIAGY